MGVCSQAVHRHDASWARRLAMPLENCAFLDHPYF